MIPVTSPIGSVAQARTASRRDQHAPDLGLARTPPARRSVGLRQAQQCLADYQSRAPTPRRGSSAAISMSLRKAKSSRSRCKRGCNMPTAICADVYTCNIGSRAAADRLSFLFRWIKRRGVSAEPDRRPDDLAVGGRTVGSRANYGKVRLAGLSEPIELPGGPQAILNLLDDDERFF